MADTNTNTPGKQGSARDEGAPEKERKERRLETGGETTRKDVEKAVEAGQHRFAETMKRWRSEVEQFCRERPLVALGISFMVGTMMRRRRR